MTNRLLAACLCVMALLALPARAQVTFTTGPRVYRAADYGAVPNASSINNATAINAAIAAASADGGGIVDLDAGTFWVRSSVVLKQNVWVRGKSASTTAIKLGSDSIASLDSFTKSGAQGNKQYALVRTDHASAGTTAYSAATWTNASKTITSTGIGNAVYVGQVLTFTGGTGVTPGSTSAVVTITGPNTITVADDVNGASGNVSDLAGTIPAGLTGVRISDLRIDCNSSAQTGPGTGDFASGTAGHPFGATPALNGGFSGLAIYKAHGAVVENVEVVDALPLQEVGTNANLCCWALSILDSRLTIVNGGRYYGAGYDAIGIRGDGTYFPGAVGTRLKHVWAGKAQRGAIQQAYGVTDSTIADCIFDNSEGVTTAGGGYFHGSVRLHVSNTVFRGSNNASTTSPCGLHVFGDNSYTAVDNVFASCSAELPVGAINGYALSIRSYKVNGISFVGGIIRSASTSSAAVYCAAWDTSQAAGSANYITIANNVITAATTGPSPVQIYGHNGSSTPAKWIDFSGNQVYATAYAGDTRAGVAYGSVTAIVAVDYAQNFTLNNNRIFGNQSDTISLDTVIGMRACTDFTARGNYLYAGAVSSDGSASPPTGTTWALSGCTRGVIADNVLSAYHKGYFFYASDSSTGIEFARNITSARTPPFSVCDAQRAIGVTAGIFRVHDNDFSNLDPTSGSKAQAWGNGFTAAGTLAAGSVVRNNAVRTTRPGGSIVIPCQLTENIGGTLSQSTTGGVADTNLLPWRTPTAGDITITPTSWSTATKVLVQPSVAVVNFTGGNWTNGTLTISKTGAFANVLGGMTVYITGGTGVTAGTYTVAGTVGTAAAGVPDAITLTADINGAGGDISDTSVSGAFVGFGITTNTAVATTFRWLARLNEY